MTETTNTNKYYHETYVIEPDEPPCGDKCPLYFMWEGERYGD